MKALPRRRQLLAIALGVAAAAVVWWFLPGRDRSGELHEVVRADRPPGHVAAPAVALPASSVAGRLVGTASGMSHAEVHRLVRELPSELAPSEQRELLRRIGDIPGFLTGLGQDESRHIASSLLLALVSQRDPVPELVPGLVALARSGEADPVVRDYCLQFLGTWLTRHGAAFPAQVPAAVRALLEAAADGGASAAGTALIALFRFRAAGDGTLGAGEGAFLESLDRLVHDERSDALARASALQIAADAGRPGVAELARRLAADESAPGHLRASAISALGRVGDRDEDTRLLAALEISSDLRIRTASTAAARILASPSARMTPAHTPDPR
ncbi:MAG TPA: HEAT repeat domain-containing protein [Longimicrobiaceae bacterium]|nr:HEAT repeat domain-containing protein [Longimicrobiaceae bacterium]